MLLTLSLLVCSQDSPSRQVFHSEVLSQPHLAQSHKLAVKPTHSLGESLFLNDVLFPVETGRHPLVATRPHAKPTHRLRDGSMVSFSWPLDEGNSGGLELLFEKRADVWSYGSAKTLRFDLPSASICLIDLDLDGTYTLQEDGWSLKPGGPVQRLATKITLGADRVHIERLQQDGAKLEATITPLTTDPTQRAFLQRLNLLRAGEGLPSLELNEELSEGCNAHAKYVWLNRTEENLDLNEEHPQLPGTSRAGRATAQHAHTSRLGHLAALEHYWESAEGRWALTDPHLIRFGVSSSSEAITVLDVGSSSTHRSPTSREWRTFLPVPAPGSQGQPLSSPVLSEKRERRQGPPLLLRYDPGKAGLERYEFELFRVTSSTRSSQATTLLDIPAGQRGYLGGRAKRKLAPETNYVAVHRLLFDGEEVIIEAPFRTGP